MQVDQDNEREMDAAGENSPHLSEQEQEQASGHAAPGPLVIHELVREQGVRELDRSFGGLALSGLAAGLSIGFSFVLQSYLQAALPDAPWARLVDSFGYCLGFLIVVLGQQQLFTETTLTALIPTLTQRTPAALLATMRVWGIVLVANLVGTWLFGTVAAQHGVFPVDTYAAMSKLSAHVMSQSFGETMLLAGAAGWLIGLMVWLLPGSGPARPMIIILLTHAVAVCQFPHIIAGSCEAWFGVASGQAGVGDYVVRFLLPTLIGNTIGGTALAALLNHAPIASELNRSGAERSK